MNLKTFQVECSTGRKFTLTELDGLQQITADGCVPSDALSDPSTEFRVAAAIRSVDRPRAPLLEFTVESRSGRKFGFRELDGLSQTNADMSVPANMNQATAVYYRIVMAVASIDGADLLPISSRLEFRERMRMFSGGELDDLALKYIVEVKNKEQLPPGGGESFAEVRESKDIEERLAAVTGAELQELVNRYFTETTPTRQELKNSSTPDAAKQD